MIRNYIITGIRNILKHKFYAFINILGLTIAITSALFIVLYIVDELSFEDFHKDAENIYRIGLKAQLGDQKFSVFSSPPPLALAMAAEIPEVEASCRLWAWDDVIVRYEDKAFTEDKFYLVDSNFFEIFTFELVRGDKEKVFQDPESIVLTESLAKKYFGDADPLGKILVVANHKQAMKVTGVAKDPPHNTNIQFNLLLPIYSQQYMRTNTRWLNNFLRTFFKVYPGSDMAKVQEKLHDMVIAHVGPELQQAMGIDLEQFAQQKEGQYGFTFQPIQDIHLNSELQYEMEPTSDIKYLYIFGAIGLFILMIGAINFMNLSTARSAGRSREVGMRKTFGSLRHHLIFQFLIESVIYTLSATFLSVLLFSALLPEFNLLSAKSIEFVSIWSPWMISGLVIVILIVGLLAGSYPAFYLSKFGITEVFQGKVAKGMKGGRIRGALVVLQFTISIFMIICTSVVYKQLMYTQNKDLGYNKDKVLAIFNANRLENNKKALKNDLLQNHAISAVSFASNPIPGIGNTNVFRKEGSEEDVMVAQYWSDFDQLDVYQFQLVAGRFFSREFPSDSSACIINESAAKSFGWEDPIGHNVMQSTEDGFLPMQVVGVVRDFHFESLRDEIRPLLINFVKEESGGGDMRANLLTVRFNTDDHREAIDVVTKSWQKFSNGEPIEFAFVDQTLDDMYRTEQRTGQLFSIFTVIAIFIASLGLFALASYTAEQRTKEIGIRKAMGASGLNIIRLLSLEFTKFVIIGFLVAIIPAYFFIDQWLQGFAYQVSYGAGIFIISGMAGLIIAIISVAYQAIKAAATNPSDALRYE